MAKARIHPRTYNCIECNKESVFRVSKLNLYCGQVCQNIKQRKDLVENWLAGGIKSKWKYAIPAWVKDYLITQRGYKCEVCGIDKWNNKPLQLQIDHIDGDATHNHQDNLRLICPNCHSQTDSYAGNNRGNGKREYRRKVLN